MLLQVDRQTPFGSILLGLFAPTDFSGAYFSVVVGWPLDPGGDWSFNGYLEDAHGRIWRSPRIQAANPASAGDPNTFNVRMQIGPVALPAAWSNAFDARETTQVWFECYVSPTTPNQVFTISLESVTIGVSGFAPFQLPQPTLPAAQMQTLFGGYIASVSMQDAGAQDGTVDVTYACRDYKVFTDGRSWNKDYTDLAMTDAQILSDILTGTALVPSILSLGSIVSTGVLALNFQYQTVTQCLNAIANATGLTWFIDPSGVFNYLVPATQPVIVALTDQPGGKPFRLDSYSEEFFSPANDVTFFGDGVSAHVWNQASIDTFGRLQWNDYDLRVTHSDTALTAAQTDLARASTPSERGQITCWSVGAKPGNVISATAARYGWTNKQLEVQRVDMVQMGDSAQNTQVTITVGDYNPTLADAIEAIAKEVASTSAIGGL